MGTDQILGPNINVGTGEVRQIWVGGALCWENFYFQLNEATPQTPPGNYWVKESASSAVFSNTNDICTISNLKGKSDTAEGVYVRFTGNWPQGSIMSVYVGTPSTAVGGASDPWVIDGYINGTNPSNATRIDAQVIPASTTWEQQTGWSYVLPNNATSILWRMRNWTTPSVGQTSRYSFLRFYTSTSGEA